MKIIYFLFISIIKSYMECNKCTNVRWCSYWLTHIPANPHRDYICIYIYIYIYINKKNQRFYNNQFGLYNSYRNNLLQYRVTYKCFIVIVCRVNYYICDNHYWKYLLTCLHLNKASKFKVQCHNLNIMVFHRGGWMICRFSNI